jgi:hypothetical protein
MFRAGFFNSRFLSTRYFKSSPSTAAGEKEYFSQNYFKSRLFGIPYFSRLYEGVVAPPTLVVTSLAIEVLPSTVPVGGLVVVVAYVYDQFNRPMAGATVTFNSTNPAVIATPDTGVTDSLGRVVKNVYVSSGGVSNMYATVSGYSAYTTITVTSNPGPNPITLTHGATIQVGSSGGGVQGPIRVRMSRRVIRWPTR